jgi:dolichyl-phosphate beta-glucosyltransferase
LSLPEISVVVPAYNEARRLGRTLQRITAHLDRECPDYELLIVDDGSSDATSERARSLGGPRATVLRHEPNRGKGFAVRRGMLAARGRLRLMTDADLSTPIEELARLRAALGGDGGVAIGSRALPGSRIEVRQPAYRESVWRLFNLLVRVLALPGLRDTQCGFKLFSADAAQQAFGAARLDGFGFDVEALFLARKHGYSIVEVPVTWRNDAATHVTLRRGLLAFVDVARVRANDLLGRYDLPAEATAARGLGR